MKQTTHQNQAFKASSIRAAPIRAALCSGALLAFALGANTAGADCTPATLFPGQTLSVGNVEICTGAPDSATFNIDGENNFCLTEVHLAVGTLAEIPETNKGNPIPGQFPYSDPSPDCKTASFDVAVAPLDHVAAHGKVQDEGEYYEPETAWADGYRFATTTWATYALVPPETPDMPEDPDPASCYQCTELACLLNPQISVCPGDGDQVQEVCTTTVVDQGGARDHQGLRRFKSTWPDEHLTSGRRRQSWRDPGSEVL
jgi:hypothetical protein